MVSLKSLISSALIATVAVAQQPNVTFTDAMIQSLLTNTSQPNNNPNASIRLDWCLSQTTLCDTLCGGSANPNTCLPDTLNWTCACTANNSVPALEYYPFSMTGNECNALRGNCFIQTQNQGGPAQQRCRDMYICGNNTQADAEAAGSGSGSSGSGSSGSTPSGTTNPSSSASPSASPSSTPNAAPSKFGLYAPGMGAMAVLGAIVFSL